MYNQNSNILQKDIELYQDISIENIESGFTYQTQRPINTQSSTKANSNLDNTILTHDFLYTQYPKDCV